MDETVCKQYSMLSLLIVCLLAFCSFGWAVHRRVTGDDEDWDRMARARAVMKLRQDDDKALMGQQQKQHTKTKTKKKKNQKKHLSHEEMLEEAKNVATLSDAELLYLFDEARPKDSSSKLKRSHKQFLYPILKEWVSRLDQTIQSNQANGLRWIRPYLLPPLPSDSSNGSSSKKRKKKNKHNNKVKEQGVDDEKDDDKESDKDDENVAESDKDDDNSEEESEATTRELVATPDYNHEEEPSVLFKAKRGHRLRTGWAWEQEWKALLEKQNRTWTNILGPPIDYTEQRWYEYPPLLSAPPEQGGYPEVTTLGQLLKHWPQTKDIPFSKTKKIREVLLHFNYSDTAERAMAIRFRDARLPFKAYNIPDIDYVTKLWTDDYVHQQFDGKRGGGGAGGGVRNMVANLLDSRPGRQGDGVCQESPNHFFAFFVPPLWQTTTMGLPPVRNNDFTYAEWAQHARYADAKPLSSDQPHFYWQAGAAREERYMPPHHQTFISRDLNTTLSATKNNFFVFDIDEQKGIQCRFGERGVTAATHYDSGQNMIAMLTGAKRYILSPPKACPDLGVFSTRESPIFRHSLLNFDHLAYLEDDDNDGKTTDWLGQPMSEAERAWLRRASEAPALETVLKAGEVLFLPSFWFHYIVSLQKSAQCNVRSGIDEEGTKEFGSIKHINHCGSDGRLYDDDDQQSDGEQEEKRQPHHRGGGGGGGRRRRPGRLEK
ncbi:hypothetical protein ACA910_009015 [Epithemia clementina (nom. ined.)]